MLCYSACWRCWRCRGDTLYITLYAGGARRDALCATLLDGGGGGVGGDALCATLLDGGVGGGGGVGGDALLAILLVGGGVGGGGDVPCAALYAGGCGGWALFTEVSEVLDVMRFVLLCILEAAEGGLCLRRRRR